MNLSAILPRALEKQQAGHVPDTCTLLLSLIMSIHLDRPIARKIGWRGVKPAGETAMTCRVAGSSCVYGLKFAGEEFTQPNLIAGSFDIYIFPPADSPQLDNFPLAALNMAMHPLYPDWVRNFEQHIELLEPFIAGSLRISAPLSGDALSLLLDSWTRLRIISLAGVPATERDWLIKPGEAEADYPAFHLLLPLFATLTQTASAIFKTTPEILLSIQKTPGLAISAAQIQENPGAHLYKALLDSRFLSAGSDPFPQAKQAARLNPQIIERHIPQDPRGERPLLHILTGFLGAGKTTFLKQWLEFLHGRERYTGVIQNEFGPVDLDSALLAGDTVVEALDDGCVCCSLADSLRPGLGRMLEQMPAHQFILETTGVANPANIKAELKNLEDLVAPGLVICVVDSAELISDGVPKIGVAADQIRFSDVIVLNKLDLISPAEDEKNKLQELISQLAKANPDAVILNADQGRISFAILDNLLASNSASTGKRAFLTHFEEGYEKMGLKTTRPLIAGEVEKLLAACGNIARAKGVIELEDIGPAIIQYAGGNLEILAAPGMEPSGLSIIGKNLAFPDSFPCKIREETS